jgi:mannose-6-phosphate isomerase-like protein (cupin superfamily)
MINKRKLWNNENVNLDSLTEETPLLGAGETVLSDWRIKLHPEKTWEDKSYRSNQRVIFVWEGNGLLHGGDASMLLEPGDRIDIDADTEFSITNQSHLDTFIFNFVILDTTKL